MKTQIMIVMIAAAFAIGCQTETRTTNRAAVGMTNSGVSSTSWIAPYQGHGVAGLRAAIADPNCPPEFRARAQAVLNSFDASPPPVPVYTLAPLGSYTNPIYVETH